MSEATHPRPLVVEVERWVPAAPSEAFAALADPDLLPRWQAGLRWVRRDTPGPSGPGTRLTAERALPGRAGLTVRYATEVRAWEPPHRVVLSLTPCAPGSTSPLPGVQASGAYRLTAARDGTLVAATAELALRGPLGAALVRRRVAGEVRRALAADLDGLAALAAVGRE